jgi:hypothetical protein
VEDRRGEGTYRTNPKNGNPKRNGILREADKRKEVGVDKVRYG